MNRREVLLLLPVAVAPASVGGASFDPLPLAGVQRAEAMLATLREGIYQATINLALFGQGSFDVPVEMGGGRLVLAYHRDRLVVASGDTIALT